MPQITIAKVRDEPRAATMHIDIVGDDGGDLIGEVIVDPAVTFDLASASMCIDKIQYGLVDFNCRLAFEYPTGIVRAWSIAKGNGGTDFNWFGSLPDRSTEMGGSGKLTLTTSGLKAGRYGSLIIALTKKR